jgi:hypothetical protein
MQAAQNATFPPKKAGKRQPLLVPIIAAETECARSNLEGAGLRRRFRRLFQTLRKTLRTRTEFAQVLEGINAAFMTVAPDEIQGVIADSRNAYSLNA